MAFDNATNPLQLTRPAGDEIINIAKLNKYFRLQLTRPAGDEIALVSIFINVFMNCNSHAPQGTKLNPASTAKCNKTLQLTRPTGDEIINIAKLNKYFRLQLTRPAGDEMSICVLLQGSFPIATHTPRRGQQKTDDRILLFRESIICFIFFEKMATANPPALDGGLRLHKA